MCGCGCWQESLFDGVEMNKDQVCKRCKEKGPTGEVCFWEIEIADAVLVKSADEGRTSAVVRLKHQVGHVARGERFLKQSDTCDNQ